MAEKAENAVKTEQTVDIQALLKAQAEEFRAQMQAQAEENKAQLEALATRNNELATELANLKANTEEENALLGEKIAQVAGVEVKPAYNPFAKGILYEVYNEIAGITTIMTGDEVQGLIGSIAKHLKKKLVEGAKEVDKHPYKIKLYVKQTNKKAEKTEN